MSALLKAKFKSFLSLYYSDGACGAAQQGSSGQINRGLVSDISCESSTKAYNNIYPRVHLSLNMRGQKHCLGHNYGVIKNIAKSLLASLHATNRTKDSTKQEQTNHDPYSFQHGKRGMLGASILARDPLGRCA